MTLQIVSEAIAEIRTREVIWPSTEQTLARLEADDTPSLWVPILKRLTAPTATYIRPIIWAITYSVHRATLADAFDAGEREAKIARLKSCVTALERYFGPIAKSAIQNKNLFGETMQHLSLMRDVLDLNLNVTRMAMPYITTLSREDNAIAAFHYFMCEELQALFGSKLFDFVATLTTVIFGCDCSGGSARANHTRESKRRTAAGLGRVSLSTDPHYSVTDFDAVVLTTN